MFRAIILAGGNGERFWPLSTPEKPKQFLDIFGGESLIRQCVRRLEGLAELGDIRVITARRLAGMTRKALPELPKANIVGEPMRRDTAAAVSLGVSLASAGAGDPVIGFFPSDQLVADTRRFRAVVRKAIAIAEKRPSIVTIGIAPTYPATGFGYINPSNGRFVEKPTLRKAKDYLRRGYLWNAGMFIARASVFKGAFREFAPELADVRIADYPKIPQISFDYAVMEKYPSVEVVKGDFGWDDVGGYTAIDRHFPQDEAGNVGIGAVRGVDTSGCICVANGAKIVTLGVKDLVIVTTKDAVLVADKSCVGEMKRLFR